MPCGVLGKVVCQTSEELYRSIRCVGDVYGVMAMATDGVEVVFLAAILESITGCASLLDDAAEDTTLKRNLILLLVYRVRCLEHGKFAVDLILDGTGKKKIDITPDEVMSNGGDWWSRWERAAILNYAQICCELPFLRRKLSDLAR